QLVAHLAGTPREMGLAHGRMLAERVKEDIRAYLDDFAVADAHRTKADLLALWKKHLPDVPRAYVEELEGLAEGAGVPLDDVLAAHAIPTVFHCSGAALSGPATKDGKLYHYRSLDYSLGIGHAKTVQENAVLFVRSPAGAIPHVVVGWAGVVGCVTGMNAAGVSLGEMGSSSKDEEEGAGTPMMLELLRILETAHGGQEALAAFRAWKRGEGYNFIVGDGKAAKAWAVEVTRSKIAVFGMGDPAENVPPHFAIEHCVRRVNHFVAPELAKTQRDPYDPRVSEVGSWIGYDLISKYVKSHMGEFDGDGMIALCRCYPPEHACLHQAVMCPVDGRIWVANAVNPKKAQFAGAQNQPFHEYSLPELLGETADQLAGAGAGAGSPAHPERSAAAAGADSKGAETEGTCRATKLDLDGVEDAGLRADLAAFDGKADEFAWKMEVVRAPAQGGGVWDVTFPSPLPSGVEVNDTVYCRYYAPQGVKEGAKAPAAIVLHHLGGSFEIEAALSDYLAKAGIAAIQVEFPYYGPRRPADQKGFQTGLLQANFEDGIKATRQAVADVRRAADWLLARPEIDPDRVGVCGISLGGITGAICAGVDPRLKRNVLVIAGGDLATILTNESRETRQVRARLKEKGISREQLESELQPVEPDRFAGRIDPRGTLMLNAKADQVIPKVATEKLWHA
ncbi:MAG TPA: C45 family autoproteolytic acyltransferase/hydrolase, partial [Planctomycetota bacterium]|nr:C45 family autoproteolytic acyltransferase/hydrolase [Planctomycetota bacterium]